MSKNKKKYSTKLEKPNKTPPLGLPTSIDTMGYVPTAQPQKKVIKSTQLNKFVNIMPNSVNNSYSDVAFGQKQPNSTAPLSVPMGFTTQIPYNSAVNSTIIQNPSAIPITTWWQMTITDPVWYSCTLFIVTSIMTRIGKYQHPNKKKQEFARKTIKRIGESKLKQAIIAPAIGMGFSVTKLNWIELLEESGKTDIASVEGLPPDSILMAVTPEGNLDDNFGIMQYYYNLNSGWQQNTQAFSSYQNAPFSSFGGYMTPQRKVSFNPMFLSAIPKDWYILHTHNPVGLTGNHYGVPAGHAAFNALMNKVNAQIKLQIALTYKAAPLVFIETDTNTTVENPDGSFSSMAQNINNALPTAAETGYAVIESLNATKFTTIDNTADIEKFQNYAMFCNDEIRTTFVTPNLVGNSGSYANAMANNQANEIIINNLTIPFKETLEVQFAKRLLDFAFGDDDDDNDQGYFELVDNSLEDKVLWAKLFETVKESGTQKMESLEDVNFWRAKWGQQPVDSISDDMILGGAMTAMSRGSNVAKTKESIKKPYANGLKKNKENTYSKK